MSRDLALWPGALPPNATPLEHAAHEHAVAQARLLEHAASFARIVDQHVGEARQPNLRARRQIAVALRRFYDLEAAAKVARDAYDRASRVS